jgi:hypothetical protein
MMQAHDVDSEAHMKHINTVCLWGGGEGLQSV